MCRKSIRKFAYVEAEFDCYNKSNLTDSIIIKHISQPNSATIEIQSQWPVGDIKLTENGDKLILSSLDSIYIFVYCTLNIKSNNHPIQKFCRDALASVLFLPLDICEI